MDSVAYFEDEFEDHASVTAATKAATKAGFQSMLKIWITAIQNGNKILFFGNGGSASDAQHLATEMVVRFVDNRKPIAALALNTDTSLITAAANDLGYDQIFARQLDALGAAGDVAVGISTSGTSPNIIEGLKMARSKGMIATGLSGRDGGNMTGLCDALLVVPAQSTRRIQEMHIMLGHMLCGALEQSLDMV